MATYPSSRFPAQKFENVPGSSRNRAGAAVVLALWLAWSLARGALPAAGLPAIDEKWRYFTSPHFELYSQNKDSDSRDVLHNLEILRAVFLERLNLQERLHLGITAYYFRTERDFQAYAPEAFRQNSNVAGFHLFRPDRAVISMAPTRDAALAQQVIFHEYVHHLFRIAERDPPLWFNEGTADVLAGMRVEGKGKYVLIGTPLEDRALYLRQESLLPLDQLFAADHGSKLYTEEKHTGVFYAQAWALMHYWHFADGGFSREAVDRFLSVAGDRDAAARTDLRKHFETCFGFDYREMQRRLQNYIRSGSYRAGRHPMPKLAPPSTYAVRPVPLDEITMRLAELAVRVDHSAAGKLVLLNAMTERPDDPRSFETLGTEAYLEQDQRTAVERWEQALAAGSKNPAVVRELALMEGRQWFSQFDESFRLQSDAATRMRERLLRSISLEPAQSAAYEMLAWVEGFAEVPNPQNVNLVIGHLPSMADKKRTLIGLSLLLLRVGKYQEAAAMLDHLGTLRLSPPDAGAVASLRTRLNEEWTRDPAAGASQAGQQTIAPPPTAPGLKTPSVGLPADL